MSLRGRRLNNTGGTPRRLSFCSFSSPFSFHVGGGRTCSLTSSLSFSPTNKNTSLLCLTVCLFRSLKRTEPAARFSVSKQASAAGFQKTRKCPLDPRGRGSRTAPCLLFFSSSRRHGQNLVMRCGLEPFRPQAAFALQGEKLREGCSFCGHVTTPRG